MKKTAVLFLFPICILLAGCGSDKKESPAVQGSSAGSGGDNAVITQLPSLSAREGARGEPAAAAEQPELPLGTREKLPFRILPSPVLPEDMFIGPLGGKDADLPVYSVLNPLMEVLSRGGKPEKNLFTGSFLEGRDFYWERFFTDFPEGDYRFRLGEVNYYAPGAASVNCRFFRPLPDGKKAAAEGEFILENQEGNWKVAGLNIDKEDLLKPHQVLSEPFEPQVYRWLQLY